MHPSYKHLEEKIRVGDLTLWQWGGVLAGITLAMLWGFYLSPFGALVTLFSAVYLAGLPALAALLAGLTEFDFIGLVRNAWRWWRSPGRYLPGCGDELPKGYVVVAEDRDRRGPNQEIEPPSLEALWEA